MRIAGDPARTAIRPSSEIWSFTVAGDRDFSRRRTVLKAIEAIEAIEAIAICRHIEAAEILSGGWREPLRFEKNRHCINGVAIANAVRVDVRPAEYRRRRPTSVSAHTSVK